MAKGKARHHAGRAGRYMAGGLMNRAKHNGVPAIVGAASELGVEFAAEHLEFVEKKFWGGPALKFAAAAFLRKSMYAHALAGAAGAELAFNYKLKQFQEGKAQHSPVRMFAESATPAAGNTSGRVEPEDAGALFGAN
jgi:hypothetical protein